jgi:hypothetical protein
MRRTEPDGVAKRTSNHTTSTGIASGWQTVLLCETWSASLALLGVVHNTRPGQILVSSTNELENEYLATPVQASATQYQRCSTTYLAAISDGWIVKEALLYVPDKDHEATSAYFGNLNELAYFKLTLFGVASETIRPFSSSRSQ